MRILVFYPYVPWPLESGTFQRTYHLLREMAGVHEVDFVALAEKDEGVEYKEVFEKFCRYVEFFSYEHPAWEKLFPTRLLNPIPTHVMHWKAPRVEERLDELINRRKYDVVHLCDIVLAQYFMRNPGKDREGLDPANNSRSAITGTGYDLPREKVPLVIDRSRVDLLYQFEEHTRLKFSFREKILRWENYVKTWAFERAVAARSTLQIVGGDDDGKFIRRFISRRLNVETLVNGVDAQYFHPLASVEPRADNPTILFCGSMDYNPNIDAMRWYFSEIHQPLRQLVPNLEVLIVGKKPVDEIREYGQLDKVIVTGGVQDVRPYYRRAWLQIVPIRIGGGSRLKIVESLAIGTPVVSTSIGAQGLGLVNGKEILLADTAGDLVRQTARLLRDSSLRSALMEGGVTAAHSRLSWPKLGQQLNKLYQKYFPIREVPPVSGMTNSPPEIKETSSTYTPATGLSTVQ